jgi:hypothetical protein
MRSNTVSTALNLITLLIGIVVGYGLKGFTSTVYAHQALPPATSAPQLQQIEQVAPNISAGSAAFGTLLAGRLATDQIAVRGFDLAKFDENLVNLLSTKFMFFNNAELQSLVDRSKAEKILTVKPPQTPNPTPPKEEK